MEANNAKWKLTDGRVTRVKHLDKVSFATVLCQSGKWPSYFDVVAFDDERHGLKDGDAVTLSGELSMRKDQKSGNYELQLIARRYESGNEAKAPRPRGQAAPVESSAASSDDMGDVDF